MQTETYNAQNHLSSGLVGYDAAGDIISDVSNQYVYDAEGRLCAVQNRLFGGWTGYLYDAAGNRVAKGTLSSSVTASNACNMSSNGFTQTAGYVVGPSGEQLTEVDAGNNWVHTNAYAGGKLIGTYDAKGLHIYVDDPLGTRRVQVNDATGAVEATYQSLPFGDGYTPNFATGTDDPAENHFTGKERDTESGNDFFNARYYNSSTGRFLSPDPLPWIGWQGGSEANQNRFDAWIANPQNLNEYGYVNNNPMNHTDPTGMNACGTSDDKTCKVTITITARKKNAKGKYDDGFTNLKNQGQYNAIATVDVNGKKTQFLAKSTPDNAKTGATVADGIYDATGGTHKGGYPDIHVNSGGPVTTIGPDPGNNGKDYATGIEIHRAGVDDATTTRDPTHPISAGCQTIQTDSYPDFQRTTGLVPTAGAPQHTFTVDLQANGSGK
ncbi:MAG: RHS repeat-associated core domain-containing protein [Acidobacteriaceae bacterium]|nr:RHS repeat-associated core domain-containing protein [Acidobacteriaceae bacterium]